MFRLNSNYPPPFPHQTVRNAPSHPCQPWILQRVEAREQCYVNVTKDKWLL